MRVGTLVEYTPREGEDSYPAVVMRQWPDGSVQLYALHFEHSHQIRAAHPAQIKGVLDPEHIVGLLVQYDQHDKRLALLEERMNELIGQIGQLVTAKPQQTRVESTRSTAPDAEPRKANWANKP